MITTICMNPSFDKTVEVKNLQIGQVNRIHDARVDLGGNGINVAVAAKRLGLDVQCLGIMGQDSAAELTDLIEKEHMTRHTTASVPKTPTTSSSWRPLGTLGTCPTLTTTAGQT